MGENSRVVIRVGVAGVASVLQAVTLLLLARYAAPANYGALGLAISSGYIAGAALSFGLTTFTLRLSALTEWRGFACSAIAVRVLTSALIAMAVVWLLPRPAGTDHIYAIVGAVFVFAELTNEVAHGVISGQHRQLLSVVILLSQRLLTLVAFLISWSLIGSPLPGLLAATVTNSILPVVVLLLVRSSFVSPLKLLAHARSFWFATAASSLSQGDVLISTAVGGATMGGFVAAGSRMSTPLNLVTSSVLNIYVPAMSRERDAALRRAIFHRARRLCMYWAGCLLVLAPIVAAALVWVLGAEYRSGYFFYGAIVVGAALSAVSQSYQALLYAEGRARQVGWAILTGTIVGLVTMTVAIVLFGLSGLAAGPLFGQSLILFLLVFADRRSRSA